MPGRIHGPVSPDENAPGGRGTSPAMTAPRIRPVRILTSGLLAGVVVLAFNVAAQLALGERVQREADAWMPGAAERMQPGGTTAVVAGLGMKLAIGIVLVWLYAVARVRWGPGAGTASLIAVTVWLLGAIFFSDFPLTGMMSWTTYAMLEALQLIAFLAAAVSGARLYREG